MNEPHCPVPPLTDDVHNGLDVLEALALGLDRATLTQAELRDMNCACAWIRSLHQSRRKAAIAAALAPRH